MKVDTVLHYQVIVTFDWLIFGKTLHQYPCRRYHYILLYFISLNSGGLQQ